MSPAPILLTLHSRQSVGNNTAAKDGDWRAVASDEDLVLESWSQGFIVGALMLMGCITIANMRKGVLLHKLILLEQVFALTHGTFCFMDFRGYGWYLSSTAALLYCSYWLHNVVAWMKVKPFFYGRTIFKPKFTFYTKWVYLVTLFATIPPLIFQIYDNFRFFNGYHGYYKAVRPFEPLLRDPWWVFCTCILFYVLSKVYGMGVLSLVKRSPRFGILLCAIILALIFTSLDIVASIHQFIGSKDGTTDGINPWWKLALVFKCLTDAILLDDFKTELKRMGVKRIKRDEKRRQSFALVLDEHDDDLIHDTDEEPDHGLRVHTYPSNATNGTAHTNGGPWNKSPRRSSASQSNGPKANMEELEFGDVLNMDPDKLSGMPSVGDSRKADAPREQVGRGGRKATRLPALFESIKPGKKSSTKRRKKDDDDVEKGQAKGTSNEYGNNSQSDAISPMANDDLERARRMQAETAASLKKESSRASESSSTQRLRGFRQSLAGVDDTSD